MYNSGSRESYTPTTTATVSDDDSSGSSCSCSEDEQPQSHGFEILNAPGTFRVSGSGTQPLPLSGNSAAASSDQQQAKKKKKHRHRRERHHMKERRERKAKEREDDKIKKEKKKEQKAALKASQKDDEGGGPVVIPLSGGFKAAFDRAGQVATSGVEIIQPSSKKAKDVDDEGDIDWGGEHSSYFEAPLSQFIFTGAMYTKDESREDETSFNRRIAKEILRENQSMLAGTEDVPIFNLRDLGDATKDGKGPVQLAYRKIYRSACISRGGITTAEAGRIISYVRDVLGVHTIIDFRNKKERSNDPHDKLIEAYFPTVVEGREFMPRACRRYRIKLMNQQFKIVGLFLAGSNTRTKVNVLKAALTYHIAQGRSPQQVFAEQTLNSMGLFGLNKLMLQFGGSEIVRVMRVCADFENYPILYHCSSGKDRTGLITAFLLSVCGVSEEEIIENYYLSEVFLKPAGHLITAENKLIGLEGFDGTPRPVMRDTLDYIRIKWKSPSNYLKENGFGEEEQEKLRRLLMPHLYHKTSSDQPLQRSAGAPPPSSTSPSLPISYSQGASYPPSQQQYPQQGSYQQQQQQPPLSYSYPQQYPPQQYQQQGSYQQGSYPPQQYQQYPPSSPQYQQQGSYPPQQYPPQQGYYPGGGYQ